MPFFKPGDIVTVRDDLERGVEYCMDGGDDSDYAVTPMLNFRGKCVTIKDCLYKYSVDEVGWNWTDEMFQEYLDYKMGQKSDAGEFQAATMDDLMSLLGCR